MWKKLALAGALVLTLTAASCPQDTQFKSLLSACSAAAGALTTLTVMKVQGRLSASQIATVTAADTAIRPLCGSPTPPADPMMAILAVERAWLQMQGVMVEAEDAG